MYQVKTAFTLVELIVSITIIAILSATGFVAFTGYLSTGRDANRITQLSDLRDGMQLYSIKSRLPLPEGSVDITASGGLYAYQGDLSEDIVSLVGYQGGGKDPEYDTYPVYMLGENKRDFQLMSFLGESDELSIIPQSYAEIPDYGVLFPKTVGSPLGILIDIPTKEPLHTLTSIIGAGEYDIITGGEQVRAYKDSNDFIDSTEGTLLSLVPNQSCKRLLEMGKSKGSDVYTINPTGSQNIRVYCDMVTNGGGWTLVHKTTDSADDLTGEMDTNEGIANWDSNSEYRLSIDFWGALSTQAIMAKNIRIDGLMWNDISYGIIEEISLTGVQFSGNDEYFIFNGGTGDSGQNNCTSGTNYWNNSCCTRCVNYDVSSTYGDPINSPMVRYTSTSTLETAIEGAGGTQDDIMHRLSKMGIFIK